MRDANYAPVYCALYPQLAEIARAHGYALAVHGSLGRDFDLICVPWIEMPSEPAAVVEAITTKFAIRRIGDPKTKHHGREAWTISVAFGECSIDLSFFPRVDALQSSLILVESAHADTRRHATHLANALRDIFNDCGELPEVLERYRAVEGIVDDYEGMEKINEMSDAEVERSLAG